MAGNRGGRGRGGRNAGGNRESNRSENANRLCNFIAQGRPCPFGAKCNFSHTLNGNRNDSRDAQKSRPKPNNPDDKKLRAWRYLTRPDSDDHLSKHVRDKFFQDALELVQSEDAGNMQAVIRALAEEGGVNRILQVVKKDYESRPATSQEAALRAPLIPFLKAISYPKVLSSGMLETARGLIYNTMYGPGGRYAIQLFKFLAKRAHTLSADDLEPIMAVFATLLDLNGGAELNDEFKTIAELFSGVVESVTDPGGLTLINTRQLLERAKHRLGIGKPAIQLARSTKDGPQPRAQFTVKRDGPGNLSQTGARHDNDSEDIRQIIIVPTFDEIMCDLSPYLPPFDSSQLHLDGHDGLIDRHFRLYREDVVGQIRDAIKFRVDHHKNLHARWNGLRTNVYPNLGFELLRCDADQGLVIIISIDQPKELVNATAKKRQDWYENRKRLQKDSLVCILDPGQKNAIFCSVAEIKEQKGRTKHNDDEEEVVEEDKIVYQDFASNPRRAFLTITPVEEKSNSKIAHYFLHRRSSQNLTLLEFPKVLLQAFHPTLAALQSMITRRDLPFAKLLAPPTTASGMADLDPPHYARQRNFEFDLSCLLPKGETLRLSPTKPFDMQSLIEKSTLDAKQAEACVHALTRELALCQGPPGTGKSYTGVAMTRVLLANKKAANLGPILVVCYTNHALDQILEHFIDSGITQVVRVGGKKLLGRSKSERLGDLNLRVVSREMGRTKTENQVFWGRRNELRADARYADQLVGELTQANSAENLKTYLMNNYPEYHDQFWGIDEDGFQVHAWSPDFIIRTWLAKNTTSMTFGQPNRTRKDLLKAKVNVWQMSLAERHAVYNFWIQDAQQSRLKKFLSAMQDYRKSKDALKSVREETDMRCLASADIIGITTSGLAGKLNLLQRLPIKVLLVEEAGEVLEAHTLTALLPSVEHAILIGDHFQLKPSVSNFKELSSESYQGKQYRLDMSLFERLVSPPAGVPGITVPFSTLATQRRMHPSISELIRRTLYPALEDAPNVTTYPTVAGVKKRLFWLDHAWAEVGAETDELVATSKSNNFEVEMTACLVAHILSQGEYQSKEIAVLTPYLGQLFKLRERLSSQFEIVLDDRDVDAMEKAGITQTEQQASAPAKSAEKLSLLNTLKVASVDNFQGEEAKVVIVSLVRSNNENNCGFLKTSNRTNVLLSRAMHGMYLIGNTKTYGSVPMWASVIDILKEGDNVGTSLALCCPRHPETPIEVSNVDDFQRFSPEGGCDLRCDRRLNCGHKCLTKCHSDLRHDHVRCLEPCTRTKQGCDHVCKKHCGDECDPRCEEILKNTNLVLPCGHTIANLRCWEYQNKDKIQCEVKVDRVVPACKHVVTVRCHEDVTAKTFRCMAECSGDLKCGHTCGLQCYFCRKNYGTKHGKCGKTCDRPYSTCSHNCKAKCHPGTPCGTCKRPCEVGCFHSRCNRLCSEPCMPCAHGDCSSSCPHSKCSMPCAAPCDWIPCSLRCDKALPCGHQCPSLCGEACPDQKYCQVCAESEIKAMVVDYLEMKTYAEVSLDEDPLIIPRCGHATLMSSMDGNLDMSSAYELNPDGTVKGIKVSEPFSSDELKKLPGCPVCRGSLRDINRYGRLVRRALLDESTKRFISSAGAQLGPLTEQLFAAQEKLDKAQVFPKGLDLPRELPFDGGRDSQFQLITKITSGWVRYKDLKEARMSIAMYFNMVHRDQTPYARLWDLVEVARRRAGRPSTVEFETPVSQVAFHIMAMALLIRSDVALLADVLNEFGKLRTGPLALQIRVDLAKNREECVELIKDAFKTKDYERAVEGHIFFTRYCAIERQFVSLPSLAEVLKSEGDLHVAAAENLVKMHGGKLKTLSKEIEDAKRSLTDGSFTQPVSSEERRSVVAAMAKEFRGTGHWYTCANGHPFTVGECGRPMELARCPQCDAPIGGQNHRPTEGVTRDEELERFLVDMRLG